MSRFNARAIGSLLESLKEAKKGDCGATKPLPEQGNGKKFSTSHIKPSSSMKADSSAKRDSDGTRPAVDGGESTHPKAVGSLLKMMQTEKDRFYEKPSNQASHVNSFIPDGFAKQVPKRKKTEEKKDFFCSLCKVNCTSQIVLDTHYAGKKHKKNVQKRKGITNPFSTIETVMTDQEQEHQQQGIIVADIQEGFDVMAFSEPLVGLEYVTEYQKPDSCHRYFCEMCELKSNYDEMLEHVVSRQHRLRFMRTHCFDIYYRVTGYPNFKNIMPPSDADKLLKQHSGFVIRRLLNAKIRLCKVKQYDGEKSMIADLQKYQGTGKVHPSRYKDLPKAEMLFEEEEAREKEEEAIRQHELIKKRKINQDRLKSLNSSQRQSFEKVYMPLTYDFTEDHSWESELKFNKAPGLLEVRQLEDEVVRSRLRAERLCELHEQERRIVIALRKLREGSVGGEMTREEAIAGKKLTLLLKTIRADKNRYELRRRPLAMESRELSTEEPHSHQGASVIKPLHVPSSLYTDTVDLFSRKDVATEQNDVYLLGQTQKPMLKGRETIQGHNDDALSKFKKVVAPIIEKTRLQVEEKIFHALSGGTLSSLIDTLKNNPELQASLKQWEQQQSAKVEDSQSKQVTAKDLKNDLHSSTGRHHFESSDSDLHGSVFQSDSQPSTCGEHFESDNSKLTKVYGNRYQNDSHPSTRAVNYETFDSDLASVHGSDSNNGSQPSVSRAHFQSIKSKPYRSGYQNDSHPSTREEHFQSFSFRLQVPAGDNFLTGDNDKPEFKEHSGSKRLMPRRRPMSNHMLPEEPPLPKCPKKTVPEHVLSTSFSLHDTSIDDRGDPKGNIERSEKRTILYRDYNHQTSSKDSFDDANFYSDTTVGTKKQSCGHLGSRPQFSGSSSQFHSGI